MKKIFTHSWWTVLVIACFFASTIPAQSQTTTTKTTTTVKSKTTKAKKTAKKKKPTKKVKKATTSTTTKKATPATPAVPATPATPAPKSTPAPKTSAPSSIEQSMRLAGSLTLSGTSTLHSWTMASNSAQGTASASTLDGELEKLTSATFIVPVRSLKGDPSALNDNAYEALKEGQYKDIRFVLSSTSIRRESAGHYTVNVSGNLTIAGVTKPITSTLTAVRNGNTFTFNGSQNIKMSTYNVERPSFMLGAMKAGDAVTIRYTVTLQPR